MKIKNFHQLARSNLRSAALRIAEAGLRVIDTEEVVRRAVRIHGNALLVGNAMFELAEGGKLIVIGVGKCSLEAGRALERILGERLTGGIVMDIHPGKLSRLQTYAGTHPFPTPKNVDATREILAALTGLTEADLVIFMISGGGSTLLCQPQDHTCHDEANILRHLFAAGADIYEINTLRKHTSLARGGHLAKAAYPARVLSLIFSDVPGAEPAFIASGPTVKDETTVMDAERVLAKYGIRARCNLPLLKLIETPKDEKYFARVRNVLLVSNELALRAMVHEAAVIGYTASVRTTSLTGEAREVGERIAKEIASAAPRTAYCYGGETTVTVQNPKGKGGRNQELALAALPHLGDAALILTLASDGRDNSDFAGALCDIMTADKAEMLGLDPARFLAENNSAAFFEQAGDYLMTGDTGANVSDLIIVLHG